MIKKLLVSVLLFNLCVPAQSIGQLQLNAYDSLEYSHEIVVEGGIDYSASSIQKDFISKFYKGGFIDEQMKDNSFNKHRAINRFGFDAGGQLEYRNYTAKLFKNKNWGFLVRAGYQNFGGLLYGQDLFGLVFYGNDRYLGDTINMSGTDLSFVSYQKLGFGFIDAKSKSNVSLNVYNISDRVSGDFRDLNVIQSAIGDEVQVVLDGEVQMKQNLKFNQGIGFGLDVDLRLSVAWYNERTAHIQFLARNVGFAYMYEKQKAYTFDTTLIFTGFRFDQLIGENSILNEHTDLLDSMGIHSSEVNRTFMLPGYLQIGKMVDKQSEYKLQSFFGVRLYPTLIYSPFIFAGADYKATNWLHVGGNLSFGGFAGFKTGVYTSFDWGKCNIGMATDNLVGLIHRKGNGESLFIRLKCAI
ncbi:MAG: hypothetical protein JKY09_06910 [Crocinitomicaceae bacterium]|nr:hypothetical protein [Crocinitomicaceae bacterium]